MDRRLCPVLDDRSRLGPQVDGRDVDRARTELGQNRVDEALLLVEVGVVAEFDPDAVTERRAESAETVVRKRFEVGRRGAESVLVVAERSQFAIGRIGAGPRGERRLQRKPREVAARTTVFQNPRCIVDRVFATAAIADARIGRALHDFDPYVCDRPAMYVRGRDVGDRIDALFDRGRIEQPYVCATIDFGVREDVGTRDVRQAGDVERFQLKRRHLGKRYATPRRKSGDDDADDPKGSQTA